MSKSVDGMGIYVHFLMNREGDVDKSRVWTVRLEYIPTYSNMQECIPNNPPIITPLSPSIQEVSMCICLVRDCTVEQRWTVQHEYTPHNPALIPKKSASKYVCFMTLLFC